METNGSSTHVMSRDNGDLREYMELPDADWVLLPREPCKRCGRYVDVAEENEEVRGGFEYRLYEYCIWCGWQRTIETRGPTHPSRAV